METEERKRLAYFCFVADVQSSMLQTQSGSMPVSGLGLSLPCCPAAWEADSAEQWRNYAVQETHQPSFYSILQGYQDSNTGFRSMATNGLSHVLVLYGLIALFRQLERRDLDLLGSVDTHGRDQIQNRAIASFRNWKTNFDAHCIDARTSMRSAGLARDPTLDSRFRSFLSNTMVLYHTANAISNLSAPELEALHRASGFHRAPPKTAGQHLFKASTSKSSSTRPIWHAGHAFREAALETCTSNDDGLFDSPTNVYTSLLVCYTLYWLHEPAEPPTPFTHDGEFSRQIQGQPCDHKELWHPYQFGSAVLSLIAANTDSTTITIPGDQLRPLCTGVREYLNSVDAPLLGERASSLAAYVIDNQADAFV